MSVWGIVFTLRAGGHRVRPVLTDCFSSSTAVWNMCSCPYIAVVTDLSFVELTCVQVAIENLRRWLESDCILPDRIVYIC